VLERQARGDQGDGIKCHAARSTGRRGARPVAVPLAFLGHDAANRLDRALALAPAGRAK
jgi:hypothetical protein